MLLMPTLGWHPAPGFSKRLKMAIENKDAFQKSVEKIMELPIECIVPGHGMVLERDAKARAGEAFSGQGLFHKQNGETLKSRRS
jgi:hypothetical protein